MLAWVSECCKIKVINLSLGHHILIVTANTPYWFMIA